MTALGHLGTFGPMVLVCSLRSRPGRGAAVVPALLALLIATGAPVLHAFAHELADDRGAHDHGHVHGDEAHEHRAASTEGEEDHEEIHPTSLHDAHLTAPPARVELVAPSLAAPRSGPILAEGQLPAPEIQLTMRSRAPPYAPPARAPPPV